MFHILSSSNTPFSHSSWMPQNATSGVALLNAINGKDEKQIENLLGNGCRIQISRLDEMLQAARSARISLPVRADILMASESPHDAIQKGLEFAIKNDDASFAQYLLLTQVADSTAIRERTRSPEMRSVFMYGRRRAMLYPRGAQQDHTELDRALLSGDRDRVLEKMAPLMAEKSVQTLWRDSVLNKNEDVLRAILLLGYAEKAPDLRGNIGNDAITDADIKKVMKEIPSWSSKRPTFLTNFNSKASFDGGGEEIVCRHLAVDHLERLAAHPEIKFDYDRYGSPEAIAANVKRDTEEKYKRLKAEATEVHLIENERFGECLVQQFRSMDSTGEKNRLLLLHSMHHVMTIGLRCKNESGKTTYVVKFFDPNRTTGHMRSGSGNPDFFRTQGLSAYMEDELFSNYYPRSSNLSMLYVRPGNTGVQENPSAISFKPERRLKSVAGNGKPDGTMLWYLMAHNFHAELGRFQALVDKASLKDQLTLLDARSSKGLSGLFMALRDGNAESIRAYAELVKLIPEEARAELIGTGDSEKAFPSILWASQQGQAEAIKAYAELLKLVPEGQRAGLIGAKEAKEGLPSLFVASHWRRGAVIRAYAELMKLVPENERAELVAAKTAAGMPALHVALRDGHAETIEAFVELVKLVPESERAGLVAAKSADGKSGLLVALAGGHAKTIEAYGALLKLVPERERAGLMAARSGDVTDSSGLSIALKAAHVEAVEKYGLLFPVRPDAEHLRILVDAARTMREAMRSGEDHLLQAAMAYLAIIDRLAPSLTPDQRKTLLDALHATYKIKGLMWQGQQEFYDRLKKSHPEFHRKFRHTKDLLR